MVNTRNKPQNNDQDPNKSPSNGAKKLSKTQQQSVKLQEKELEIANLKKLLEATKKAKTPSTGFQFSQPKVYRVSKMTPEERTWYRAVHDANRKFNWSKVKFCFTTEKLVALTAHLFDKWNLKEFQHLAGDDREQAKLQWVAQNQDLVRLSYNELRNSAQANLRGWAIARLQKGEDLPEPSQILDCATREPEYHTDPEKQKIFDLYHDELLFKVVGKEHWDTWMRHYGTISEARPSPTSSPYISVNTEGFLVALYTNCHDKWKLIHEQATEGIEDKKRENPRHKTPMIDSDAGQAKWGGWNKFGRQYVKEVSKKIAEARDREHVPEMEAACLQRVRNTNLVDERDNKRNKKRKAKVVVDDESEDEFDQL